MSLTGWKALYPRFVKYFENAKSLRLERVKQHQIRLRCHDLHGKISSWAIKRPQPQDILPKVLDVAFTEPFKSYLFEDSDTEPTFIADKDELAKILDQFTEEWDETRNQLLLSLIPTSTDKGGEEANEKGKGKEASLSALNLATTFFQCSSGQEDCPSTSDNISYPRILAHEYQRPIATTDNCRDTDPEGLQVLSINLYSRPWLANSPDLVFDQVSSDVARMIVQEFGENPDEITAERMDEIGHRIECVRCSGPVDGRYVMKWRMAVSPIPSLSPPPAQLLGIYLLRFGMK